MWLNRVEDQRRAGRKKARQRLSVRALLLGVQSRIGAAVRIEPKGLARKRTEARSRGVGAWMAHGRLALKACPDCGGVESCSESQYDQWGDEHGWGAGR